MTVLKALTVVSVVIVATVVTVMREVTCKTVDSSYSSDISDSSDINDSCDFGDGGDTRKSIICTDIMSERTKLTKVTIEIVVTVVLIKKNIYIFPSLLTFFL